MDRPASVAARRPRSSPSSRAAARPRPSGPSRPGASSPCPGAAHRRTAWLRARVWPHDQSTCTLTGYRRAGHACAAHECLVSLALAAPAHALDDLAGGRRERRSVVAVFAPGTRRSRGSRAPTPRASRPVAAPRCLRATRPRAPSSRSVSAPRPRARRRGRTHQPRFAAVAAGEPRVGATVTPVAGHAGAGGWGTSSTICACEACRDAAGTDCRTLSAPDWETASTRNGPVVLSRRARRLVPARRRPPPQSDREPASRSYIAGPSEVPTLTAAPRVAFSPLTGPITSPVRGAGRPVRDPDRQRAALRPGADRHVPGARAAVAQAGSSSAASPARSRARSRSPCPTAGAPTAVRCAAAGRSHSRSPRSRAAARCGSASRSTAARRCAAGFASRRPRPSRLAKAPSAWPSSA